SPAADAEHNAAMDRVQVPGNHPVRAVCAPSGRTIALFLAEPARALAGSRPDRDDEEKSRALWGCSQERAARALRLSVLRALVRDVLPRLQADVACARLRAPPRASPPPPPFFRKHVPPFLPRH